jgi:hypothetical protein
MSLREIQIPHRHRDDRVLDVVDCARELGMDGEDLAVTEAIAFDALERGLLRVGDLLDHVENLGPDDRRRLLDRARLGAGLKTVEATEGESRYEMANQALRPGRDADGKLFQPCASPGCVAYPNDQGIPTAVRDRIWWCDRHRDQAGPEDHLPPDDLHPRLDPATMRLLPSRAEEERMRREEARLAEARRERDEQRRRERAELARVEQRYRENARPINIAGWRVRAGGVLVDEGPRDEG